MDFKYLKEPIKIKWYITNKCNLKCKFCYLENHLEEKKEKEKFEDIELILNILRKIKPLKVALLGGEPTESLYFLYIIRELEKIKINYSFSTNGQNLYMKPEILNFLKNSEYLEEIQISIESGIEKTNDSLRGIGTYKRVIKTIQALNKFQIKLVLAIVINKKNYFEIENLIKLAEDLKVNEIRIIPFIPIGIGEKERKDLFLTFKEINSHISELKVPDNLLLTSYSNGKNGGLGCGAGTISVVINNDLTLSACDLMTFREKTNIKICEEKDFFKIWENDFLFKKWRKGKNRKETEKGRCAIFSQVGGYK